MHGGRSEGNRDRRGCGVGGLIGGLVMGMSDILICEGGDLLFFYLIVGEFLLVLLPIPTRGGGLDRS